MPKPTRCHILTRILIYLYGINAFSHLAADTDLWGHLKFGQDIWEQGGVAYADPYSYTAFGHEWINHEWLAELVMYLFYMGFGSTGLLVLKLALGLTVFHILSQLYFKKSDNLWAYAIHFLLLTHVIGLGFATRPGIFSILFTTVLVWILHSYFDGNRRMVYWAPLLMLAWTNTHGGVVAGLSLLGMVTVVESVRCCLVKEPQPKPIWAALALCVPVILINPHGYKLWLFFLETIPRARGITEWDPLPVFSPYLFHFKIMALLFFAGLLSKHPKRAWELSIMLFGVFFAFRHQRHTVLAGILLTPFVPLALSALLDRPGFKNLKAPSWLNKASLGILGILILVVVGFNAVHYARANFKIQIDPRQYPVHAVHFMLDNGIKGNFLVFFDWGEYLIWKFPGSKVSIDGRLWTVYPEKVVRQNSIFQGEMPGWEHMLKLYRHDVILTIKKNRGLEEREDWVKIYEDDLTRLFIPKTDPASPLLQRFYDKKLIFRTEDPSFEFP